MELSTNDPIVSILARLDNHLDFYTREEDNRSPYNKAYSLISDEIQMNGEPTTERAYHLLLVGGIKTKEDRLPDIDVDDKPNRSKTRIYSGSRATVSIGGEVVGDIKQPKQEKRVNKLSALSALMALGMGVPGFPGLRRKVKTAPKPKMALSNEETEKLSSLAGRAKKQYVKELKQKYNV